MTETESMQSILQRTNNGETPKRVLVAGASGGIGQAFCEQLVLQYPDVDIIRLARKPELLPPLDNASQSLGFDLLDEASLRSAVSQLNLDQPIDWVFIATGWLHDSTYQPEKTYRTLDSSQMMHSYALNAVGPTLLVKALLDYFPKQQAMKIGILSARVGSTSDNRLGGWHSYRASKAALNMLIKNYAIELNRLKRPVTVCGLQPGTTDTELSAPFQRNVAEENLQTPEYTSAQLIKVIQALQPRDSGLLFDFLGLPFEP